MVTVSVCLDVGFEMITVPELIPTFPRKQKKTAEVIISLILCNIWQCEIVCKLIIEAKYRLVPKSVTLNDLDSMTANLCYLCGS